MILGARTPGTRKREDTLEEKKLFDRCMYTDNFGAGRE